MGISSFYVSPMGIKEMVEALARSLKDNPALTTKIGIAWTIAVGCLIALFYVIQLQMKPFQVSLENVQSAVTEQNHSIKSLETRVRSVESSNGLLDHGQLIKDLATIKASLSSINSSLTSRDEMRNTEHARLWVAIDNLRYRSSYKRDRELSIGDSDE